MRVIVGERTCSASASAPDGQRAAEHHHAAAPTAAPAGDRRRRPRGAPRAAGGSLRSAADRRARNSIALLPILGVPMGTLMFSPARAGPQRFPYGARRRHHCRTSPGLANARDEQGVSALLLSLYHRRPEARDALLAAGAPVGPLEAAALGDVAKLDGADLSVRGGDGFTPLHLAAFFGGADAVRAILATGSDPDADAENTFRSARCTRPPRSATTPPSARCWRRARTRTCTSRAATRRCTRPRTTATRRSRNCCWTTGPTHRHRRDGQTPLDIGRGRPAQPSAEVDLAVAPRAGLGAVDEVQPLDRGAAQAGDELQPRGL